MPVQHEYARLLRKKSLGIPSTERPLPVPWLLEDSTTMITQYENERHSHVRIQRQVSAPCRRDNARASIFSR